MRRGCQTPLPMTGVWRLRAGILTLVGMIAVHQGRYVFATHEHEHELAPAHGYLAWLVPAAGVLLFLAVVQLAARLGRADDEQCLPELRVLWWAASATLVSAFGVQESLETLFAHGHLPALSDLLGGGGWAAIALAIAVGGLIALLLRGAAGVVRRALSAARCSRRRGSIGLAVPREPVLRMRGCVLARRLAGRGPPALL